jgi:DNA-binding NtrC family response regulator
VYRLCVKNASNKKSNHPLTKSPAMPAVKERILVQDDDEPILEIMCSMLAASGYDCLKATSPKKAWTILKSGKGVAVVICGLLESSEDGFFERTIKTFPDVPIVVASACYDFSIFARVLRKGAYDWLLKPFEREQLLVVVRRALEYRRLKLENRTLKATLAKTKSVDTRTRSGRSLI